MTATHRVRLLRNGRHQEVRIPRDMELDTDEVILRREGDCLILEPTPPLLTLLASLNPIDEAFPDVDER